MLVYMNRVQKMAAALESIVIDIDDKELAISILNGLPDRFQTIITAFDAIVD